MPENVMFKLPSCYFGREHSSSHFPKGRMISILRRACGMEPAETEALMHVGRSCGITIECTPTQFATFIILRYDADERCANGIRNLEPRFVPAREIDEPAPYIYVANRG